MVFLIEENGYLYEYDTQNQSDVELFFDGTKMKLDNCYVMCKYKSVTGYDAKAKRISKDYVCGAMEEAYSRIKNK